MQDHVLCSQHNNTACSSCDQVLIAHWFAAILCNKMLAGLTDLNFY